MTPAPEFASQHHVLVGTLSNAQQSHDIRQLHFALHRPGHPGDRLTDRRPPLCLQYVRGRIVHRDTEAVHVRRPVLAHVSFIFCQIDVVWACVVSLCSHATPKLFVRIRNSIRSLATSMRQSTDLLKLYMVPSILYCVYNNLAFVNLLKFDPTTYYLLLQFRVVITGVIFQVN